MTNKVKTLGIFIGRFQPLHKGHETIISTMLSSEDFGLVIVGSADSSKNILNPFSYDERLQMINAFAHESGFTNLSIRPMIDYKYQDHLWLKEIKLKISNFIIALKDSHDCDIKVILYGFHKDATSFYLDLFPEFSYKEITTNISIDSTTIRKLYFKNINQLAGLALDSEEFKKYLSQYTLNILKEYSATESFKYLQKEFLFLEQYKKDSAYKNLPYDPIFVATDAMVVCGGHILLIKRNGQHGHNTVALPGGFLDSSESIMNGILRELKEETKIDVPPAILKNSIKAVEIFDDPRRSMRGRTITHCGLIILSQKTLPNVKGSDDAKEAFWIPINEIDNIKFLFFEDHYYMIQKMLTKLI